MRYSILKSRSCLVATLLVTCLIGCSAFGEGNTGKGPCSSAFLNDDARTRESGLTRLLAKPIVSPIALFRSVFGKTNRNSNLISNRIKNGTKEIVRDDFFLADMVVQSGHNILRSPETIKKIIQTLRMRDSEGMEKLRSDPDKIEFYEIRNEHDELLWVEVRGGHHRVAAFYLYLLESGLPLIVSAMNKLVPGSATWKVEFVGSKQNYEKVPLGGTPLENFSGVINRYDSKKAPTFHTYGNNRSRTDVNLAEASFATMNSLTSNRKVGFLRVSVETLATEGGLTNFLKVLDGKAKKQGYFQVVLLTQDVDLRIQLRAVLNNFEFLNHYVGDLKRENDYVDRLEHSKRLDVISARLKQIYQTHEVSEFAL